MKSAKENKSKSIKHRQIIELKKQLRELEFIKTEIERHVKLGKGYMYITDFDYLSNKQALEGLGYLVVPCDHQHYQYKIVWDEDCEDFEENLEDALGRLMKFMGLK